MTKWLLWGPAAVLILSAALVPGGLIFFGLPLVWLGGVVLTRVASDGAREAWPERVRTNFNRKERHER
jgi:hypothetical protein